MKEIMPETVSFRLSVGDKALLEKLAEGENLSVADFCKIQIFKYHNKFVNFLILNNGEKISVESLHGAKFLCLDEAEKV